MEILNHMDVFYDELIKLALGLASAVLVPVLTAIAIQALRRLNIQLTAAQEAMVETHIANAAREAEEWAAARIRANLPVDSGAKLERAVASVLERVPGLSRERAIALIHAVLPLLGLGASRKESW